MVPKVIVFDFDGTALGGHEPYNQFPSAFVEFLDGLAEKNIRWATNTTWAPEDQFELIQRSGVRSEPLLLSGQTGLRIARVKRGRLCVDQNHHDETMERIRNFRKSMASTVNQILSKLFGAGCVDKLTLNYYEQCQISYRALPGKARKTWSALTPLMKSGAYYPWNPTARQENLLLPHFMCKSVPLRYLTSHHGLRPEEIMVAGDEVNDLGMFDPELAHWMVCPCNAHESIKRIVKKNHGAIGREKYSWGVISAASRIIKQAQTEL